MKTKSLLRTFPAALLSFPAIIAGLSVLLPRPATAQALTILHSFTRSDGSSPNAGLIVSGNKLYGTALNYGTLDGGGLGNGAVFAVNTDGTGFTNLHIFSELRFEGSDCYTNGEGANPKSGLALSGNTLYGTTSSGGTFGQGTVFAMNTDGTGFTNLHNFSRIDQAYSTNNDGASPYAGLIISASNKRLYGTTELGGSDGVGTVFAVNTDGTGFTNLHSFVGGISGLSEPTNHGGAFPRGGLTLSENTLYGTAYYGGDPGSGTVFAINTDGTGFRVLHLFTKPSASYPYTNSDGTRPHGGLILSGSSDILYGTASIGGSAGNGTVFALHTDGTGFTNLHNFPPFESDHLTDCFTNNDGYNPYAGLVLSANTLYGTTANGGSLCAGTVFSLNTDGLDFATVQNFAPRLVSNGSNPFGGLILTNSALYGTTSKGGSQDSGTVFSLSIAPQLTITASGPNIVLTWPGNNTGFNLQYSTSLDSTTVWTNAAPAPVVESGRNTVTNPICGTQRFYRLSK